MFRLLVSIVGILLAMPILALIMRPFFLFRGLTPDDKRRKWPGDDEVPGAMPSGSRAITIRVPAEQLWPWITQIGQDRAGFYSYRWLENLVGARMPKVESLRPEWKNREAGQKLLMAPTERFGPIAAMEIVEVRPWHHMVAKNSEGTWAFIVEQVDLKTCRFIARGTWRPSLSWLARFFHATVFDPIHYIMVWKMLREVKRLAERRFNS
ncbi:MAG: hypothetical protein GC165_17725 [Armatimonadetes bacterium]|nr:hypothetical protein [Armatimonadota bacterium]